MAIDFSQPDLGAKLERARRLIGEAYEILCDEIGAPNPADNQFLREAQICVQAGLIWTGDRGGIDAVSRRGAEVEIKSTRLDPVKRVVQFPTSRYVSPTVIERFRQADYWLLGVFDQYESLIALYRVGAPKMKPIIDELARKLRAKERAGTPYENNPKIPLARIRPNARRLFLSSDFKEIRADTGRVWLERKG